MATSPASAKRTDDGAKLLNQYVEARLAESDEGAEHAVAIYQDALKQQPDNALIAGKTYVKAIETGNWELALRAVRSIELSGNLEKEMPALLFADAFQKRNWTSANTALAELKSLNNFAFLEPMLSNWVKIAQNDADGISFEAIENDRTAKYYLEEQLILSLLATGDDGGAMRYLRNVIRRNDVRMSPIRMIAARHFLAKNNPDLAKDIIAAGKTIAELKLLQKIDEGKIKQVAHRITAKTGAAYTFQRLSADMGSQRATFLALVMAQVGSNIIGNNDFDKLVLGRAYVGVEKSKQARKNYQLINHDSPYYIIAKNAAVRSYLDDEKYDEALKSVNEAIKRNPNLPEFQILLGQIYLRQNDNLKAVDAYKRAITFADERGYSKPVLAGYYLTMGSAQDKAGLWPDGLRSLEKANAFLPDSATILNYLGYAQLERRENAQEAMTYIRKAYALQSSSPAITDSLGWAYFIIGEHEKAVGYLEKALVGQPQDPTINEHLGDAYWSVGREYEARYAWKSAKLFVDKAAQIRLGKKIDLGLTPDLISP